MQLAGLWRGIALAAVVLMALEAPAVITQIGLRMAISESPATQTRGIGLLRMTGRRANLLEACYSNGRMPGNLVDWGFSMFGDRVSTEQARAIHYRVTGTPFNMIKPPSSPFGRRRQADLWLDFDPDVGGDAVQGRIRGLSLQESRLDGVISPGSAVTYSEWTMVFRNSSPRQQEARMVVTLPTGGAVSRLTLWVDGEEREAAFAGRSQVKQAYQKVVQRRRDPVLVTTAGPDSVLVQCFPVPPGGGSMKIRVGITAPLDLGSTSSGILRLPFFSEHNFNLPETTSHSLWLESPDAFDSLPVPDGVIVEQTPDGRHALRGTLPAATLQQATAIHVTRDGTIMTAEALDERGKEPATVHQEIREKTVTPPPLLTLVIDGSRRMKDYTDILTETIMNIPDGMPFRVLLAGDQVLELSPLQTASQSSIMHTVRAVEQTRFTGGCDNVPALTQAWDATAATAGGVMLWMHATQPVILSGTEALRQRWERRPDNPVLLSLQCGGGPDVIVKELGNLHAIHQIGWTGNPEADIARLMALWSGTASRYTFERSRVIGSVADKKQDGSSHIVRLWALDEIGKLSTARDNASRAQAVELAGCYQLVTPVSGAVVLETQAQFAEAGLEAVAADTVPVVPEPATWMLFFTGAIVLLLRSRRSLFREKAGHHALV